MSRRFAAGTGPHLAYNLLLGGALALLSPAWVPYVLIARKRRATLFTRLGLRPSRIPAPSGKRRVWVHAVSVGETLSAASLLRQLRRRDPDVEIVLSTVTLTGQEAAARVLGSQVDALFHFPFDLPMICARFLDRVRPDAVAIIETEIWPNFIAACARRDIPVVIVNGRISDKSFGRYRRLRFFFGGVLNTLSAVSTQTEEDARRFRAIGADPRLVAVMGNMKFDITKPQSADVSPLRTWMAGEKGRGALWLVAGSTHEGEEEAVLAAFAKARSVNGSVRLLVAPRHPERFDAVEALCLRGGWRVVRKTALSSAPDGAPEVVLLDTVGELMAAYAAADIAFVGGSLAPRGGHNILEPALYGVPVVTGPHMENFQEIADIFTGERGLIRVRDAGDLEERLAAWAGDPDRDVETGRRARGILDAFRGAADRNAEIVLRALSRGAGASR